MEGRVEAVVQVRTVVLKDLREAERSFRRASGSLFTLICTGIFVDGFVVSVDF